MTKLTSVTLLSNYQFTPVPHSPLKISIGVVTPVKKGQKKHTKKRRKVVKRVRNRELKIRFSDEEYAVIKQKAGSQSLAQYMRDYCLMSDVSDNLPTRSGSRKDGYTPKITPRLLHLLAGAVNNLNQIAKLLNSQQAAKKELSLAWAAMELAKIAISLDNIEQYYTVEQK